MQLKNTAKDGVLFAEKGDLSILAAAQPGEPQEPFPAKGICVDQSFLFRGLPPGVKLQTKGETAGESWSLDPDSPYGTHWFLKAGTYKLTLNRGGKIEIPVLFVVPAKSQQFTLTVKDGAPVPITLSK